MLSFRLTRSGNAIDWNNLRERDRAGDVKSPEEQKYIR